MAATVGGDVRPALDRVCRARRREGLSQPLTRIRFESLDQDAVTTRRGCHEVVEQEAAWFAEALGLPLRVGDGVEGQGRAGVAERGGPGGVPAQLLPDTGYSRIAQPNTEEPAVAVADLEPHREVGARHARVHPQTEFHQIVGERQAAEVGGGAELGKQRRQGFGAEVVAEPQH